MNMLIFFDKGEIIINKLVLLLVLSMMVLVGCQVQTGNFSDNNATFTNDEKPNQESADADLAQNEDRDSEDAIDKNIEDTVEDGQQGEPKIDGKSQLITMREFIHQKKNPVELKQWMDQIIGELSIEDATIVVAYYEEYLINYGLTYEETLNEEDYQIILFNEYLDFINSDNYISNTNTIKEGDMEISDPGLNSLLDEMYESGYVLKTAEGYFFPVIDYTYFTQYKDKISDELYDYFVAMSLESEQSFAVDAALMISWDELASRIYSYEEYLNKYPDSIRKGEMQTNLLHCMYAYLLGLDNSPMFDYGSNEMDEELLKSYQNSVKNYPNTELAGILDQYLAILDANDYKLTEAVGMYQTELVETLTEKLDSKTYRYYGLVIEKMTAEHEKHDISYPVLSGLEDQILQEKINKRLYESINALLIEEAEGQFNSTNWTDYHVQRFDEDILSVTFDVYSYMEGAAHPNYALISTNINLKTGEEYSLDQLFAKDYDYKQDLYKKGKEQIEDIGFALLDEFKGIEDEQEFYLTSDGLVIYYQPYVYTPYAYGPLELYFNYSDLSHLILPKP